ncbi:MAG: citryl-CoA lyase [Nitriliruptoraceae bacterium]|nr:citryl-CoA lyase [Nitriliruptoraceae bacterium]
MSTPYSHVSSVTDDGRIRLRDRDLVSEVIGHLSFTEAIHLAIRGETPSASEVQVLDAVLVALIDHGVTSSTLAARMTYRAAPEALQGAIAAGVLNSGGRVLGAMEGCARLLERWAPEVDPADVTEVAAQLVAVERSAGRRIPGLGHAMHEAGDLRADRLFEVARDAGHAGVHVDLLLAVVDAVEAQSGRALPINVTGAIGAVLVDLGYPAGLLRGFGILSRVPGLIAHLGEEMETGTGGRLIRHLQHGDVWSELDA